MRKNKFWKLSLSERIQEQEESISQTNNNEEHPYKQRILYTKSTSFDNGLIKQSSTLTTADDDDYQCYLSFSASNDNEEEMIMEKVM